MSEIITSDVWVAIIAACADIGIGFVFHYLYRDSIKHVRQIQEAETFTSLQDIKNKMIDDNKITYGCIQGCALKMDYSEAKAESFWTKPYGRENLTVKEICKGHDVAEILEKMETPSWSIYLGQGNSNLQIKETGKAWMIWDIPIYCFSLNQVSGLGDGIMDMTDTMYRYVKSLILKGNHVTGIGRFRLERGRVQLEPPDDGYLFVIANMSKDDIIRRIQRGTKWWKLRYVFPVIGAGLLSYIAVMVFRNYRRKKEGQTDTGRGPRIY